MVMAGSSGHGKVKLESDDTKQYSTTRIESHDTTRMENAILQGQKVTILDSDATMWTENDEETQPLRDFVLTAVEDFGGGYSASGDQSRR